MAPEAQVPCGSFCLLAFPDRVRTSRVTSATGIAFRQSESLIDPSAIMTVKQLPLGETWKENLQLHNRTPPDLFEYGDDIRDTPYAPEILTALNELGLSAIFCVSGVPTVAIRRAHSYEFSQVSHIRSALWNQGLASVLIDISERTNTIRVFSLARVFSQQSISTREDSCLIDELDTTTKAIEKLRTYLSGAETGRIWREYPQFFREDERVDSILLNNISVGHNRLKSLGLSSEQSQAAIIQSMFIAYLEDRKIIDATYIRNATDGIYDSWEELLNSGSSIAVQHLFSTLSNDFNEDLFNGPCSFSESADQPFITTAHLQLLRQLRLGKEQLSENQGRQMLLWNYNFRYIPVELVNAIYDRFLGDNTGSRKSQCAYYTPACLVDTVVTSTWKFLSSDQKKRGVFLDPACGSGIFIVRMFQLLCRYEIDARPTATPLDWTSLVNIARRLRGHDINPSAVRIALFSLYSAILEKSTLSRDAQELPIKRKLPNLWGNTLQPENFLTSPQDQHPPDVVIGNPPWGRIRSDDLALYTRLENSPMPRNEVSWAFVWKSLGELATDGVIAFLLPSMAVLHNQSPKSIQARSRLFDKARVRLVANLSDLRHALFPTSVHSTSILIASVSATTENSPYPFEYFTPKADSHLAFKNVIALNEDDRRFLTSRDVEENALLFKQQLWLRNADAGLFQYLSSFPKLGHFIRPYRSEHRIKSDWQIGCGFSPLGRTRSTALVSQFVGKVPNLPVGCLAPMVVDSSQLVHWHTNEVYRRGFEPAFEKNRIAIATGMSAPEYRIRAALVDGELTFSRSIMAVTFPSECQDEARFIVAFLNSRLATWYAFHGTSEFGVEEPKVGQAELLRLPFPHPVDLPDSNNAKDLRESMIHLVAEFSAKTSGEDDPSLHVNRALRHIDQLVYDYFGLSVDEVKLVDETVESIIPAVQPRRGTYPSLLQEATLRDRRSYADALTERLAGWLVDQRPPAAHLIAMNADYAILQLSISDSRTPGSYREDGLIPFPQALADVSQSLGHTLSGSFFLAPDIRVFSGDHLYLIKPLQRRFWLHGSALSDADSIVVDLETGSHGHSVGDRLPC